MITTPIEEVFWSRPLDLPSGLDLHRLERVVSRRPGPGGRAIDDLAELRWEGGFIHLLVGYKAPALARDVRAVAKRLRDAIHERRFLVAEQRPATIIPALATDQATPSLIDACLAEGLALLDLKGTVVARAPGVFIHVRGSGKARRVHAGDPLRFVGVPGRVIRILLSDPLARLKGKEIAARADAAYSPVHEALIRLEKEGFVYRESPRTGFLLRDPLRLLRAWIASGDRTVASIEPFYAPDVSSRALANAAGALQREGIKGIWTLASGLRPEEIYVSGLPHGIYLSGSSRSLEQALGLRRVTPHNFLVLRAEPAAETEAGGIYFSPRQLAHGPAVMLAQLAADLAASGGRGQEEAEFLVDVYAKEVLRS